MSGLLIRPAILLWLGALALLSAPVVAVQSSMTEDLTNSTRPGDSETEGFTLSKRVDEVNVIFTVTDSHGRFVSDLPQTDFSVLDNHLPPSRINYFQQQTDLPLRVALLVDLSDSVRHRFKFEQQAAVSFLKKVLHPGKDQILVVGFDSEVRLVQDLTGDSRQLEEAITNMKPGGETAMYDAVIYAANKLGNSADPRVTRRAIVLISDGVDTRSRSTLLLAEQALARSEAVMYALSTNNSEIEKHPQGDVVLGALTISSGGHILPAHEKSDLQQAFRQIEKALRSQYAMGYHPSDFKADGSYRPIEIHPLKPRLRVQNRKGYFAPRESVAHE